MRARRMTIVFSWSAAVAVTAMKLRPGDVVADLGAGSGPFVVPFARAVSAKGKVYAVDIDKGFFSDRK